MPLTQAQFNALNSNSEKLDYIYSILPKPLDPGEKSNFEEVFGSKVPKVTPVFTPPSGTPEFEQIFGSYPNANFGASSIANWKKDLARWEGAIDLTSDANYFFVTNYSMAQGLGVPLAYEFDGLQYITFSVFRGRGWRRPLSNYRKNPIGVAQTATVAL